MGIILRVFMNAQINDTQCSLLLESNFAGMQNNKILDLSLPLLLFATRLSKIHALDDEVIVEIRDTFANQVLAISGSLSAMHCHDEKDLIKFRYCLCVFIDEMLLRNESIMNSDFTNHTLTNRLFNEMLGGDKFYGIAGQYLLNPSKYKDMLEFIYACLILGYKGKYTVDKQGDEKINHLCNDIAAAITPALDSNEDIAFNVAHKNIVRNNVLELFKKRYLKPFLLIVVMCTVVVSFFFSMLKIESNNTITKNTLMQNIKKFKQENNEDQ